MKKYLITIWSQNPEHYFFIENQINFLLNKKKNITLIYPGSKKKKLLFQNKNYFEKKIFFSKKKLLNNLYFFFYIFYLTFLTFLKKPDIIIIYNNHPILFAKIVSLFFKKKIIYHNFDYDPEPESFSSKFFNFIEKKSIYLFDLITFSNIKRANFFRKKNNFKKLNIIILFNVLSIKYKEIFYSPSKKLNKLINIFRIGTIGPGHGLLYLVNCLKFLPYNYKLTLCGNIVDKKFYLKLTNLIKKENLSKKVRIIKHAHRYKWEKLLSNADVGVALYENTSLSHKYMVGASQKVNCYLASGLPIIAFKDKQFLEFHKNNKCCICIDTKNPKIAALMINKKINNKKQFMSLRENSLAAFKKRYNFENEISKIKQYLL